MVLASFPGIIGSNIIGIVINRIGIICNIVGSGIGIVIIINNGNRIGIGIIGIVIILGTTINIAIDIAR